MVANSMRWLPDSFLCRLYSVKGNSYPAVAALISREESFLGGERPFSGRVGDARVSTYFGIPMVILTNHTLRDTLICRNGIVTVIWGVAVKNNLGRLHVLRLGMWICAVFCSNALSPPSMLFLLLDLFTHQNFFNSAHRRRLGLPGESFPPQSAWAKGPFPLVLQLSSASRVIPALKSAVKFTRGYRLDIERQFTYSSVDQWVMNHWAYAF